ncbi:MAG TPA: hypothetical protein VMY99_00630 [Nevskiaceae bacterium]|nr:hypothetical protein [Nevskiaceae bacterium]
MKQLEHIMQKEMTRKEFLATLGFGIASLLGFSSIIRFMFGRDHTGQRATHGYGASFYGK